jgi:hypothetical protein
MVYGIFQLYLYGLLAYVLIVFLTSHKITEPQKVLGWNISALKQDVAECKATPPYLPLEAAAARCLF